MSAATKDVRASSIASFPVEYRHSATRAFRIPGRSAVGSSNSVSMKRSPDRRSECATVGRSLVRQRTLRHRRVVQGGHILQSPKSDAQHARRCGSRSISRIRRVRSCARMTSKSGDAAMADYQLKGRCTGYKRGFEFELTNGQTWAQTCTTYEFHDQLRPDVTLESFRSARTPDHQGDGQHHRREADPIVRSEIPSLLEEHPRHPGGGRVRVSGSGSEGRLFSSPRGISATQPVRASSNTDNRYPDHRPSSLRPQHPRHRGLAQASVGCFGLGTKKMGRKPHSHARERSSTRTRRSERREP